MKGDFSRLTFDPRKHYSAVRMQQGRVQLDSDWNEQMDILLHRFETEVADFIGRSGIPAEADGGAGFRVTVEGGQVTVAPGRCYVAGKLFANDAPAIVPAGDLPAEPGQYVAYLDAWQRHVTPLEDDDLREPALGGPDTSTRVRNVWRVRLAPAPARPDDDWAPPGRLPVGDGGLAARVASPFASVENQLYRVEIHEGGPADRATFKWSRENGSVAARVDRLAGRTLVLSDAGRDQQIGFGPNQWVELTSPDHELRGAPGSFVQIAEARGPELTLTADAPPGSFTIARRWESAGALPIRPQGGEAPGWLPLESEIEVRFALDPGRVYNPGDYWAFPARALLGGIAWPRGDDGEPELLPPAGERHFFVPLALLTRDDGGWSLAKDDDLRLTFHALDKGFVSKRGDRMSGVLRADRGVVTATVTSPRGRPLALNADGEDAVDVGRLQAKEIAVLGEPAAAAPEPLRLVRGVVKAEGSAEGAGFTISRPDPSRQQAAQRAVAEAERRVAAVQAETVASRGGVQRAVQDALDRINGVVESLRRVDAALREIDSWGELIAQELPRRVFPAYQELLLLGGRPVPIRNTPDSLAFHTRRLQAALDAGRTVANDTAPFLVSLTQRNMRRIQEIITRLQEVSRSVAAEQTDALDAEALGREVGLVVEELGGLPGRLTEILGQLSGVVRTRLEVVRTQVRTPPEAPQIAAQAIEGLLANAEGEHRRLTDTLKAAEEGGYRAARTTVQQATLGVRAALNELESLNTRLQAAQVSLQQARDELKNFSDQVVGRYLLSFSPPFAGTPAVTLTAVREGDQPPVMLYLGSLSASSAEVRVVSLSAEPAESAFSFVATGPRPS